MLATSALIGTVFIALAGALDSPFSIICGIIVVTTVAGGAIESSMNPDTRGFALGIGLGVAGTALVGGFRLTVM